MSDPEFTPGTTEYARRKAVQARVDVVVRDYVTGAFERLDLMVLRGEVSKGEAINALDRGWDLGGAFIEWREDGEF